MIATIDGTNYRCADDAAVLRMVAYARHMRAPMTLRTLDVLPGGY